MKTDYDYFYVIIF